MISYFDKLVQYSYALFTQSGHWLCLGENSNSTRNTEAESVTMALTKMVCYGSDLLTSVEVNQLLFSGWCYGDGEVLKLAFPCDYHLLYLNQKSDILRSCMALFSKGMALEFKFYYEILKIGLVAKASKQQLKLPQATAWTQSSIGDIPNADLYQQQQG